MNSLIKSLNQSATIIQSGGLIAYPTESSYGLGVYPKNIKAIDRIFEIKERDRGKPISLLISSVDEVSNWAKNDGLREKKLMKHFWPGGLTLVFEAKKSTPSILTAGSGKIALRISSHPLARKLTKKSGGAITTTSANFSGKSACYSFRSVLKQLGPSIDGILSEEVLVRRKSSTVLDVTGNELKILREGQVSLKDINKVL